MKRGIDITALSPAERVVAGAGTVLFINGFLPWWYRIRTPGRTYLHNAGLTGGSLVAVVLGFVAVVFVVVRSTRRSSTPPTDYVTYIAVGIGTVVALGIEARSSRVEWIGFWLAGVAAVLLVVGGVQRRRERRTGWR